MITGGDIMMRIEGDQGIEVVAEVMKKGKMIQ